MNTFLNQTSQNSQVNTFEIGGNPEQKEQFDKNLQTFKENYEQKLKNILPEDLVKKIGGSFELLGDLNNSLKILLDNGVSFGNLEKIKTNLNNNIELSREDLNSIFNEISESDNNKNLDLRLGDIISKSAKKAESLEDDNLFNLASQARNIQQNGSISEKTQILIQLERALNGETGQIDNLGKLEPEQTLESSQSEDNVKLDNTGQIDNLGQQENEISFTTKSSQSEISQDFLQNQVLDDHNISMTDEGIGFGLIGGEKHQNIQNQENIEQGEVKEKQDLSNNQFVNILDNLRQNGDINNEKFQDISEQIGQIPEIEQTDFFLDFVGKNISGESKENILKKFKNEEKIDENNFEKTDFSRDIKGKLEIDKDIGGLEIMLAESYVYLPNKNSGEDFNKEKSIDTSLNVSMSKILSKNTSDFKRVNSILINDIKTEENINVKYNLLKELHKNSLKQDALSGKASEKQRKTIENGDKNKEELKQRYQEIKKEIENLNKSGDNNDNSQKIQELNKELQEVIIQAQELDRQEKSTSEAGNIGSLSSGGQFDKGNQNTEKSNTTLAGENNNSA